MATIPDDVPFGCYSELVEVANWAVALAPSSMGSSEDFEPFLGQERIHIHEPVARRVDLAPR